MNRNEKADKQLLVVTSSPHIRSKAVTGSVMLDVLIALTPAAIAAVVIFGLRALWLILVCVGTSLLSEYIYRKLMKQSNTILDGSAAVTGLLVALNLPVGVPFWIAAIGCIVAIIVVKQLFGGLGRNFANPAIVARIVLLISFPLQMNTFSPNRFQAGLDAATYATPFHMEWIPNAIYPTNLEMFFGIRGGVIGETCILALVIGLVYMLVRRTITITTPLAFIGTVFIAYLIMGKDPVFNVMAGGLFLGAIFMATDYVTSPTTEVGKLVFGIGAGLITVLIRMFSDFPEGVSFAILIMNILNPQIEKLTRIKAMGEVKAK